MSEWGERGLKVERGGRGRVMSEWGEQGLKVETGEGGRGRGSVERRDKPQTLQ